jgi:hypothetical protein
MLRCAQSPRSNVLPKYACARRFFARLASETFFSGPQSELFSKLLEVTISTSFFDCDLAYAVAAEMNIDHQAEHVGHRTWNTPE